MPRTTNRTEQFFLLTRNGETVARSSVGSHAGLAAWARLLRRLGDTAGTDLRPTDETGRRFEGGFTLEGPFARL